MTISKWLTGNISGYHLDSATTMVTIERPREDAGGAPKLARGGDLAGGRWPRIAMRGPWCRRWATVFYLDPKNKYAKNKDNSYLASQWFTGKGNQFFIKGKTFFLERRRHMLARVDVAELTLRRRTLQKCLMFTLALMVVLSSGIYASQFSAYTCWIHVNLHCMPIM
jgi:hypothetical protein